MKQITLGTTGITVPQNAFGALPIQRVSADEAVRLLEFRGQLIHHVVKHAFAELGAAVAGHAAAHGLIADLHGLDRNAALRKNFLHFPQSDGRVAACALGVLFGLTRVSALGVPYLRDVIFPEVSLSPDGVTRRSYPKLSRRPFTIWQKRGG
mgnify:CR=1 FL=1